MQATRAPVQLPINGKIVELGPLTLNDMGRILNIVGGKIIAAAQASGGDLNEAFSYVASLQLMGPEMLSYMRGNQGLITMLTLSIKHTLPDFTEEEAYELLSQPESRQLVVEAIKHMLPQSENPPQEIVEKEQQPQLAK